MSYIITSPCVGVCDTACVDVFPVDCIHEPKEIEGAGAEVEEMKAAGEIEGTDNQLYIDPETCINCGACEPECPVNAIYPSEEEVPEEDRKYIAKNYEFFGHETPEEWVIEG